MFIYNLEVIDEYLAHETKAGRVFGRLITPPYPNLHISRFGVIPKKNKTNSWKLILDLSFPFDRIRKDQFPVTYSKVDDAIAMISEHGKGRANGKD